VVWPVEVTAASLGDGQLFVFARDLSERRAAAEALRESEERLALALRGTNDGLWDYDCWSSVYLSPRWKEMLGYGEAELPSTADWVAPGARGRAERLHRAGRPAGRTGRGPLRAELPRHKDGHWMPVLSVRQLVRDDAGQALRLIGTHQDLSERHRAEQSLRESEDKLRSLFESPLGIAMCTMEGRLVSSTRPTACWLRRRRCSA
jgi:PAS domain S-box-containing protein